MNQAGHIDAVVTNDVDTFLFGGRTSYGRAYITLCVDLSCTDGLLQLGRRGTKLSHHV